ncbi:MAG: CYTH domain-containing protein [Patescibacteria group bacterium]
MNNNSITPSEKENEAKNLLTSEEFEKLKKYFGISKENFSKQTNQYFIDKGNKILTTLPAGTTLRVREKSGKKELQFKLPTDDGTDEYHYDMNNEEVYNKLVISGFLPDGKVSEKLLSLGIEGPYLYKGQVHTHRAETKATSLNTWEGVTICLDESYYPNGSKDFEIEIESGSMKMSNTVLRDILNMFNIPRRVAKNKVTRFLESIS